MVARTKEEVTILKQAYDAFTHPHFERPHGSLCILKSVDTATIEWGEFDPCVDRQIVAKVTWPVFDNYICTRSSVLSHVIYDGDCLPMLILSLSNDQAKIGNVWVPIQK